ncbi:MAG: PAS domain S-box protein, partial [Piscinibacter sp.]|nr:PAS domain S-box protein [Piscinibacter sp.]
MIPAAQPARESERLALLRELQLPAATMTPALSALARQAARACGCRIGAVSVVDERHQWMVASSGARVVEQPREQSFSAHALDTEALFEIEDVAADPRFAGHPLLDAPTPTRFFAGMPIRLEGLTLGTVSVVDRVPRRLEAAEREALQDLAVTAAFLFESRLREVRQHVKDERVRVASAAGSDWLWESDAQGVLTWVSDSVQAHTGWPASREIGVDALSINRPPPGELRAAWDRYRADRDAHRPFRDGIAARDSAHGPMLISISGQPMFDALGRFAGYRGAARNITREVADRAQARRAQDLLLQAIDSVRAGVMISGPDGRVLLCNQAWRSQIGPFGDLDTLTWEELVRAMVQRGAYPEAAGREEDFIRWRLSLASPEATPHQLRFLDQDVLVSDQQLPDGSVVHLSLNISERLAAERALRASQERLAAVLRAVPDLWMVIDADDRYADCSDDVHPWLVVPFAQLRGQRFGDLLTSELAQRSRAALQQAREKGELQRFEYELQTLDGLEHRFEARVAPMPGSQLLFLTRDITELRRLERDILVMQRAVEADAAVPIVVTDATRPDLPIIYINPAFERLTGYTREEVLGRNCRFLQGGETDQPGLQTLREALRRGEACTVLLHNRRRDGSPFHNELHVAPVLDAAGRPVQYIGVLNDVSDRVRAAERLRISEDLYRSVAATISDGLLVIGPNGSIIASNPSACEMLGVPAADLVGHGLRHHGFRLHTEDDRPVLQADHPVRQVLLGQRAVRDEPYLLHRPDGDARLMLVTVLALQGSPSGLPASCLVTFRDITDQRAAENALAAAEARWKFALEGAGDGVWDYDEDTRNAYFSPRWKEMLGFAEHEIGSSLREWLDRVHPDDRTIVQQAIDQYRGGVTPGYRTEHRLHHRDGRWIWVLDRGKIVERHADGRPRRVVGTHTDITLLKRAEQALLDKQAAELASRAKTEFLSRMSHEIRTPLNAVIGFSQLLRLQPDSGGAKVAEYADHVLRASEHLLALVNEVLDLQRVEAGRIPLQTEPIEIAPFAEATLELVRPAAQQRGVAIDSRVPRGRWLSADARALRQVLVNVMSNAVKYNRQGGWVCITLLEAPPGRCVIGVEDTGAGLSDAQLARLFQPFERLGHETSGIQGTGLGLVIARGLTEQMGGTLALSSVPGAGTLARIELAACA